MQTFYFTLLSYTMTNFHQSDLLAQKRRDLTRFATRVSGFQRNEMQRGIVDKN